MEGGFCYQLLKLSEEEQRGKTDNVYPQDLQ